jgi:plastocyanin
MKRSVWITIGVGAVVVIAAIVLMGKHPSTQSTGTNSTAGNSYTSNTQNAAIVTYTSSGFSPATTTVKSGDSVTFTNKTSEQIQVDSDPHPVHTDDTDLNVGPIGPGSSKTVTLTKKGTFGIHNHLDPGDTAKITIQ